MNYEAMLEKAHAAGKQAAIDWGWTPGYDKDCCGFAWITVKPCTGGLGRYLKKVVGTGGNCSGGTGTSIWIGDYGQCITAKEKHAYAAAASLREQLTQAGETKTEVYADTRVD